MCEDSYYFTQCCHDELDYEYDEDELHFYHQSNGPIVCYQSPYKEPVNSAESHSPSGPDLTNTEEFSESSAVNMKDMQVLNSSPFREPDDASPVSPTSSSSGIGLASEGTDSTEMQSSCEPDSTAESPDEGIVQDEMKSSGGSPELFCGTSISVQDGSNGINKAPKNGLHENVVELSEKGLECLSIESKQEMYQDVSKPKLMLKFQRVVGEFFSCEMMDTSQESITAPSKRKAATGKVSRKSTKRKLFSDDELDEEPCPMLEKIEPVFINDIDSDGSYGSPPKLDYYGSSF